MRVCLFNEIFAYIYVHIKHKPKLNGNESASYLDGFYWHAYIHYGTLYIYMHTITLVCEFVILLFYILEHFLFCFDAGHFPNLDPVKKVL